MPAPLTEFARDGMLSEPEAWREIARRIAENETKMSHGLCYEAYLLGPYANGAMMFPNKLADRMAHRAITHARLSPDVDTNDYAFPRGTHREERILAALWLALEAESENGNG